MTVSTATISRRFMQDEVLTTLVDCILLALLNPYIIRFEDRGGRDRRMTQLKRRNNIVNSCIPISYHRGSTRHSIHVLTLRQGFIFASAAFRSECRYCR
jgi:hypothetical protein